MLPRRRGLTDFLFSSALHVAMKVGLYHHRFSVPAVQSLNTVRLRAALLIVRITDQIVTLARTVGYPGVPAS